MKTVVKSAFAALAFSVLASGAAFAADCCKDGCNMPCCEKKDAPAPGATEHQH
ncbi:MAG: hypothetical protein LPJ86_09255 [Caulobacteraceae bacterium]|nr:hypothetical protein [Caulobacteraceae bacterium]